MATRFPDLADDDLTLRAWSAGDVDMLVSACNDPELRDRLGVPVPYTANDARDYVGLCATGWVTGDQFTFAVVHRATASVVGSVRVGPSPGGATAGYWTAPWARGRGVASGALRLVTAWPMNVGLSPIRLYVSQGNTSSQRVAAKASYRPEASGAILKSRGKDGDLIFVTP